MSWNFTQECLCLLIPINPFFRYPFSLLPLVAFAPAGNRKMGTNTGTVAQLESRSSESRTSAGDNKSQRRDAALLRLHSWTREQLMDPNTLSPTKPILGVLTRTGPSCRALY